MARELNLYYSAGCSCKDFTLCRIFVPAESTVNLGWAVNFLQIKSWGREYKGLESTNVCLEHPCPGERKEKAPACMDGGITSSTALMVGRSAGVALLLHVVTPGTGNESGEKWMLSQPLLLDTQPQWASDHPTCHTSTAARPRPSEDGCIFQGWVKSLIFKSRRCR